MSKFPACFEDDHWARDCLFEETLFITTVLVSHCTVPLVPWVPLVPLVHPVPVVPLVP